MWAQRHRVLVLVEADPSLLNEKNGCFKGKRETAELGRGSLVLPDVMLKDSNGINHSQLA